MLICGRAWERARGLTCGLTCELACELSSELTCELSSELSRVKLTRQRRLALLHTLPHRHRRQQYRRRSPVHIGHRLWRMRFALALILSASTPCADTTRASSCALKLPAKPMPPKRMSPNLIQPKSTLHPMTQPSERRARWGEALMAPPLLPPLPPPLPRAPVGVW